MFVWHDSEIVFFISILSFFLYISWLLIEKKLEELIVDFDAPFLLMPGATAPLAPPQLRHWVYTWPLITDRSVLTIYFLSLPYFSAWENMT